MSRRWISLIVRALAVFSFLGLAACSTARISSVTYNGWHCLELSNGRVDVVVAPQLGGRIVQLRLGGFEYLWVNRNLEGKVVRYGPDDRGTQIEWANYGGDKLWPAPQGWSGPQEWPGPPDPIEKGGRTDSGPFQVEILQEGPDGAAIRLTGPDDLYAGIRFSREIRLPPDCTTVNVKSTMVNVVDHPVRWGIWQVTQHAAGGIDVARGVTDLGAWVPIHSKSRYPGGYRVLYGAKDNPQFQVGEYPHEGATRKIFRISYGHQVGKVGLDSNAGWLAVTHETSGHLFAHTFPAKPDAQYPDDASVEFWTSGPGWIRLGGRNRKLPETEPWLMESEILSPFARLGPGESYSFESAIHLSRFEGPVLNVTGFVAILKPVLQLEGGILTGRFAVFHDGTLEVKGLSAEEEPVVLGSVDAGEVVDLEDSSWAGEIRSSRDLIVRAGVAAIQLISPDGQMLDGIPITRAD